MASQISVQLISVAWPPQILYGEVTSPLPLHVTVSSVLHVFYSNSIADKFHL